MSLVMITVENVLANEEDLRTAQPTKWAKPLYDGIRSQFNVCLLTSTERDVAKWWLKRERIWEYSNLLVWPDTVESYPLWRISQAREYLAQGWEIACFIDANTEVLDAVGALGVLTFTVSYPTKPVGWRGEASIAPRPWQEVVGTVEVQNVEGD